MCLTVDKKATADWIEKHKGQKRVVVWKIVVEKASSKSKQKYRSFYKEYPINAGWYRPSQSKVQKSTDTPSYLSYDTYSHQIEQSYIYGGAIHAYRTRQDAREYGVVLRCEALVKDMIAVGIYDDICFKKIWVPAEQLK